MLFMDSTTQNSFVSPPKHFTFHLTLSAVSLACFVFVEGVLIPDDRPLNIAGVRVPRYPEPNSIPSPVPTASILTFPLTSTSLGIGEICRSPAGGREERESLSVVLPRIAEVTIGPVTAAADVLAVGGSRRGGGSAICSSTCCKAMAASMSLFAAVPLLALNFAAKVTLADDGNAPPADARLGTAQLLPTGPSLPLSILLPTCTPTLNESISHLLFTPWLSSSVTTADGIEGAFGACLPPVRGGVLASMLLRPKTSEAGGSTSSALGDKFAFCVETFVPAAAAKGVACCCSLVSMAFPPSMYSPGLLGPDALKLIAGGRFGERLLWGVVAVLATVTGFAPLAVAVKCCFVLGSSTASTGKRLAPARGRPPVAADPGGVRATFGVLAKAARSSAVGTRLAREGVELAVGFLALGVLVVAPPGVFGSPRATTLFTAPFRDGVARRLAEPGARKGDAERAICEARGIFVAEDSDRARPPPPAGRLLLSLVVLCCRDVSLTGLRGVRGSSAPVRNASFNGTSATEPTSEELPPITGRGTGCVFLCCCIEGAEEDFVVSGREFSEANADLSSALTKFAPSLTLLLKARGMMNVRAFT